MIEGLKPYAEYKESGHRWLGSVPNHWSVLPNRALFDEVKDRNHPKEEMLSVTITRGIVRQKALLDGSSKKDSSNLNKGAYKLVQPHDIAYNKMRAWQGALGASTLRGIISPAYVVMRPRKEANPWFYHNLYRTPSFAKEAERWSYGITSDMWSLRPEHFKVIGSVLPPPDEQAAIVRFLDHANQKIDGFIRAKRKLIGLLNEQKQAIIHRAVTRGLHPDVPLKPSGIPWLGDIPMHWEAVRGRRLFTVRTELARADDVQLSATQSYGVIPQADYEAKIGRRVVKISMHLEKRKHVEKDDFVISMRSFQGGIERAWAAGAIRSSYVVMKPDPSVDVSFFSYVLKSPGYIRALQATGDFIRDGQDLTYGNFRMVDLPLMPLPEQKEIAAYIESATKALETSIARTEREIALMQEYRTRLTADLVTGKLDVREAAAHLPSPPIAPAADETVEEIETEEIEP
jgi:type I restriction enzyme, S subunit